MGAKIEKRPFMAALSARLCAHPVKNAAMDAAF
jgi:hypothetical protein